MNQEQAQAHFVDALIEGYRREGATIDSKTVDENGVVTVQMRIKPIPVETIIGTIIIQP